VPECRPCSTALRAASRASARASWRGRRRAGSCKGHAAAAGAAARVDVPRVRGTSRACGPSRRHAPCMLSRRPRHAARSLAQQAALRSVTQGRHSGTSLAAAARASGSSGPRGENWPGPHPAPSPGTTASVRRRLGRRPVAGRPLAASPPRVKLGVIHGQKIQWEDQSISQLN